MSTYSCSTNGCRRGTSPTKHFPNKFIWLSNFRQKYFFDQGEHFERRGESDRHVWRSKYEDKSKGHMRQSKHEGEHERLVERSKREDEKEMH